MNALIWLALVSCAISLILTPLFRDIFRSWGLVDHPDQDRKIHKSPIPRGGGMAIAVSYAAACFIVQWRTGILDQYNLSLVWKILPAACTIFLVGVVDDLWGLKPWQKLAGQVVAAGIACYSGVVVQSLVGKHVDAWWGVPATVVWLLACSNAFNLVDGMDGLAAGVGIFATLTMFVAALIEDKLALAMATIPLAGSLIGFLRYNFNPATIFLGDSGSLTIGFLLGCFGIVWTDKSTTLLGIAAPVMALSLPLLDTGLAIFRRFLGRQPIFSADRGHIHHRLLDSGMSTRKAAAMLYVICCLGAVFSLLARAVHDSAVSGVIVLLFCAAAWIGIQYPGYTEFSLAGKMLFGGGLQRNLKEEIDLGALRKSFRKARTPAECARLVEGSAGTFGLIATHMRIAGEDFAGAANPDGSQWAARVAIAEGDWIDFARVPDSSAGAVLFLDAVAASLRERIPLLDPADTQTTGVVR